MPGEHVTAGKGPVADSALGGQGTRVIVEKGMSVSHSVSQKEWKGKEKIRLPSTKIAFKFINRSLSNCVSTIFWHRKKGFFLSSANSLLPGNSSPCRLTCDVDWPCASPGGRRRERSGRRGCTRGSTRRRRCSQCSQCHHHHQRFPAQCQHHHRHHLQQCLSSYWRSWWSGSSSY